MSPLTAAPAPFSCFPFPEAHFRSCRALPWYLEAQRQRCLPWAWEGLRAQQRGKLSQQFRPHVLVEPLICWIYHLQLSQIGLIPQDFGSIPKVLLSRPAVRLAQTRSCPADTLQSVGFGASAPALPKRRSPQAKLDQLSSPCIPLLPKSPYQSAFSARRILSVTW